MLKNEFKKSRSDTRGAPTVMQLVTRWYDVRATGGEWYLVSYFRIILSVYASVLDARCILMHNTGSSQCSSTCDTKARAPGHKTRAGCTPSGVVSRPAAGTCAPRNFENIAVPSRSCVAYRECRDAVPCYICPAAARIYKFHAAEAKRSRALDFLLNCKSCCPTNRTEMRPPERKRFRLHAVFSNWAESMDSTRKKCKLVRLNYCASLQRILGFCFSHAKFSGCAPYFREPEIFFN